MLNEIDEKLKAYVGHLQSVEEISREIEYFSICKRCKELQRRIENFEFHVVVIGQFKRGKSTLINYFFGEDLLPTGIVPITSIITKLKYGDMPKANVIFENGDQQSIDIKLISQCISEQENSENIKKVDDIEVFYPSELLEKGLVLIDTPGIDSVYKHNTQY